MLAVSFSVVPLFAGVVVGAVALGLLISTRFRKWGYLASGVSDAPLSSGGRGGRCSGFFVFPHSADDAVGEMAFVGSSGFAAGFALS
ncbi:MAG: hypothetical protein GY926_05005, partial [bacterium]|nr:hypothetical protein [bacterium]